MDWLKQEGGVEGDTVDERRSKHPRLDKTFWMNAVSVERALAAPPCPSWLRREEEKNRG